jgi:hypothetical protein
MFFSRERKMRLGIDSGNAEFAESLEEDLRILSATQFQSIIESKMWTPEIPCRVDRNGFLLELLEESDPIEEMSGFLRLEKPIVRPVEREVDDWIDLLHSRTTLETTNQSMDSVSFLHPVVL